MAIVDRRQAAHTQVAPSHEVFTGLAERLRGICSPGISGEDFLKELLRLQADFLGALYAAAWAAGEAAGQVGAVSELAVAVGPQAARLWRAPLRDLAAKVLAEGAFRVQAVGEPGDRLLSGSRYVAMGIPVAGEGAPVAALTVVVREEEGMWRGRAAAGAQMIAGYGLLYSANRSGGRFKTQYEDISKVWDLVGASLAFEDPASMAQVLANRARSLFDVKRVTVGFNRRGKVAVAAVSEQDTFDKRGNLVRMLRAAQEEALAEGRSIAVRPGRETSDDPSDYPAHAALSAKDAPEGDAFSVPFRADEEIVALWTFEADAERPLTEEKKTLIQIASGQIGPVLALARKGTRGFWRRCSDGLHAASRSLFGSEHPWRRAAAVLIGVCIVSLALLRATVRVNGRCVLEPSIPQTYCAPFDSILMKTPVLLGDTVEEGQVLLELDREDIELALLVAESELAEVEAEMHIRLTREEMPQFSIAFARRGGLLAKITLLEKQAAEATVRAGFKGIVLVGDLRQLIGSPVRTGDPLLKVAPLDKMTVLVELDEEDVTYVKPGQEGVFTLKARPDVRIEFGVAKIRPRSEVRQNRNVFVVEAEVINAEGWLRPGMEGVAKIATVRRNLAWVYTRRLVNWIRMHIW